MAASRKRTLEQAQGVPQPAPRKPIIVDDMGPGFEGWRVECRRPNLGWVDSIRTEDPEVIKPVLEQMLLSWNFVDEMGKPLAQPSDGGLDVIMSDWELLIALFNAYAVKCQPPTLPNDERPS